MNTRLRLAFLAYGAVVGATLVAGLTVLDRFLRGARSGLEGVADDFKRVEAAVEALDGSLEEVNRGLRENLENLRHLDREFSQAASDLKSEAS